MILVLLVLLAIVAFFAQRAFVARFALPVGVVRPAAREVVARVEGGAPYAYQYVLSGSGGPDVGNHDTDKLVVRADQGSDRIVVRVAPVDRQGRRTGRSRVLLLTR